MWLSGTQKTTNVNTARDSKWNGIQIDILEVNLELPNTFVPGHIFFSGPIASDTDRANRGAVRPSDLYILDSEAAERGAQSTSMKHNGTH
jgi:hypothetical protein